VAIKGIVAGGGKEKVIHLIGEEVDGKGKEIK
jgi:hypothetical protein